MRMRQATDEGARFALRPSAQVTSALLVDRDHWHHAAMYLNLHDSSPPSSSVATACKAIDGRWNDSQNAKESFRQSSKTQAPCRSRAPKVRSER